ncbi:IS1 family transposase [Leminorella richardii]|uniref:IS1 family transposase n=1 Tax=Leminorella richardii TaxID=158841 RepID=UPI0011AB546E|nr:IS1 family transposase [Leminorella richardii]
MRSPNIFNPRCPYCHENGRVTKHGKGTSGLPRYYCKGCWKTFQTQYYYPGNHPVVNEQVSQLIEQGWTPGRISAHLKISVNTVSSRLKLYQQNKGD